MGTDCTAKNTIGELERWCIVDAISLVTNDVFTLEGFDDGVLLRGGNPCKHVAG